MTSENNITEYMRAKLAVWDYPVSDMYTKIWQTFGKMKDKRNANHEEKEICKSCPDGQEMCQGINCTTVLHDSSCIDCLPFSMEEALVQIRATPERPRSDNQGFALIADATDAR